MGRPGRPGVTSNRSDPSDTSKSEVTQAGSAVAAADLAAARRELLSDGLDGLKPAEMRQAVLELHETWLIAKAAEIGIAEDSGFAIVGVGGLGRRELLPYSGLDLVLLHDGKPAEVRGPVADKERLSVDLIAGVRRQWRSGIRTRMDELVEMTHARWLRLGRIAHRAEPDLKSGRGGLRDVQMLNALALAQLIDRHGMARADPAVGSLDDAYLTLLDVRTELHLASRRGRDQLLAQFADEISAALGVGDRFDLARMLSSAGRTISFHAVTGLRTASNALPRRGLSAFVRRPKRRPL